MAKNLSEMTNEELWQLFPIVLSPYNPQWPHWYENEKDLLSRILGPQNIARINHIGSTSVPGLLAKPTIDILMEIEDNTDLPVFIRNMESSGYIYSPQPDKPAPHMMFMKGYTPHGFMEQVFHIHIRYRGDWEEIRFRDYLRMHPEAADEYARLKLSLEKVYKHDRDGYTLAKTEFISRINALSLENDEEGGG